MESQGPVSEFKLVLVGDGGVGKTTFVKRHLTGEFEKKYIATLGVEVHPMPFFTSKGQILFNVWDTAGQERFKSLIPSYIKDSAVAIVCYDVTNAESFQSVDKWIEDAKAIREDDVLLILVGNKSDMESTRQVTHD